MENLLKPGERIDDLQFRGLKLIQDPESFCFGTDAVLLADFATIKKNALVCDLGTGTGILPILLWGRHEFARCDAVEIQPSMAEMASRSMRLNGLQNHVNIWENDLRSVHDFLPGGVYGTVICNPPYQQKKTGEQSHIEAHALSRHEETCTLDDVCRAAAFLLKYGGSFALIQRSDRLADVFSALRACKLEPKRCRLVQSRADKPAYAVLVEAIKGGKQFLRFEPTLILFDENGEESPEVKRIYHRKET